MKKAEDAKAINRGVGDELRLRREALGASRAALVEQLPSGICERTLLAYEHGVRQLTIVRLVELSKVCGVGATVVLGHGLQRAQVTLKNIPLRVDLNQLLASTSAKIRPLHQWAKNRMRDSEGGVVEVLPPGVQELAASVGLPHDELACHLASFIPPM